jgi:nucleotide-binding universal stress UspA family protein
MAFNKILVPVDFSKCSGAALDYALELAKALGASLEVIHAFEIPAFVPPQAVIALGEVEATLAQHAEREARVTFSKFLSDRGIGDIPNQVLLGPPALSVLERLERGDIDMVVMGTHGRTGLTRWVMGSTAEKVVRGAPCPVLTVRTPEE